MKLGEAKHKFLNRADVWDTDFQEPTFVRDLSLLSKYRGSVRLSAGLFYTSQEWEDEKRRDREERLP